MGMEMVNVGKCGGISVNLCAHNYDALQFMIDWNEINQT